MTNHEPNAVAQNTVLEPAPSSVQCLTNGNQMNQTTMGTIMNRAPESKKVSQAVRCDLCNIDCNSMDTYRIHVKGKKHKKKLEGKYAPSPTSSQQISKPIDNGCRPGVMSTNAEQVTPVVPSVHVDEEPDRKKQKLMEAGVGATNMRVCQICKVFSNSERAFADHLSGKKHAAKALAEKMKLSMEGTDKTGPNESKNSESGWCEVCKISCNSFYVLYSHIQGKKHKKKMEMRLNPDPPSTNEVAEALCSSTQNTATQIKSTTEDLEAKKTKIMENGTAIDSVKTCNICNVVCNSKAVFLSHLRGQKHAAMLKQKEAEDETTIIDQAIVELFS